MTTCAKLFRVHQMLFADNFDVSNDEVSNGSVSDEQVVEWFSTQSTSINIEYLRHEIDFLSNRQRSKLFASINIDLEQLGSLTNQQVISLAFSQEFRAFVGIEQKQLTGIDIEGYREQYADELIDCYFGHLTPNTTGTGGTMDTGGGTGSGTMRSGTMGTGGGSGSFPPGDGEGACGRY